MRQDKERYVTGECKAKVPGARIELATPAFSGRRSTTELPRHMWSRNCMGCNAIVSIPAANAANVIYGKEKSSNRAKPARQDGISPLGRKSRIAPHHCIFVTLRTPPQRACEFLPSIPAASSRRARLSAYKPQEPLAHSSTKVAWPPTLEGDPGSRLCWQKPERCGVRQFGAGREIYGQGEIHQPVMPHINDEIGGCWDLKAYACDHSASGGLLVGNPCCRTKKIR
jgi:hypothetical protein